MATNENIIIEKRISPLILNKIKININKINTRVKNKKRTDQAVRTRVLKMVKYVHPYEVRLLKKQYIIVARLAPFYAL